jgi:hypothetical protein
MTFGIDRGPKLGLFKIGRYNARRSVATERDHSERLDGDRHRVLRYAATGLLERLAAMTLQMLCRL